MARMITFTPTMARSAFRISHPCSKETSARASWESQRSSFYRYMQTNTRSNPQEYGKVQLCLFFFFLMLYLKVHSSLKVQSKWACLRPSPGMPRRQAWRSSDCLWCRRQWAEDKWGGGGRQRRAHPSCWGWFHHVLLCGWRWVSWDV